MKRCVSGATEGDQPLPGGFRRVLASTQKHHGHLSPSIAQRGLNVPCRRASAAIRGKTTTKRAPWHEEFPLRRPIDGSRPERNGGDVAPAGRAGGDRHPAGGRPGGGRGGRRLRYP